jgi:hypothetical protein
MYSLMKAPEESGAFFVFGRLFRRGGVIISA